MSKVIVVNEYHLQRTPDGKCWSSGILDYQILCRYLSVFEEVLLAVRVKDVKEKKDGYVHLCSGEGVTILPITDFSGLFGYIKNNRQQKKIIKEYCSRADCAIVRVPNAISYQFLRYIDGHMPYALEVGVEPWSWLAPGNYKSIFRPVIRCMFTFLLKLYCKRANGVAYVTKDYLQRIYPCRAILKGEGNKYFTTYYSTVSIDSEKKYNPKIYEKKESYEFIHVANAFTTYAKGHKEAIEVIKKLNERGVNAHIRFVGDGPLKEEFARYAHDKGVGDKVEFIGRINSKEGIWKELRKADLFIFPTHSEGLPRVVVESMYVGTPVVATEVGGIPELLGRDLICKVGDTSRMTDIIIEMLGAPEMMTEQSNKCQKKH